MQVSTQQASSQRLVNVLSKDRTSSWPMNDVSLSSNNAHSSELSNVVHGRRAWMLEATDKSKFLRLIKTYEAQIKNRMNVSILTSESPKYPSIKTWMPGWKGTCNWFQIRAEMRCDADGDDGAVKGSWPSCCHVQWMLMLPHSAKRTFDAKSC